MWLFSDLTLYWDLLPWDVSRKERKEDFDSTKIGKTWIRIRKQEGSLKERGRWVVRPERDREGERHVERSSNERGTAWWEYRMGSSIGNDHACYIRWYINHMSKLSHLYCTVCSYMQLLKYYWTSQPTPASVAWLLISRRSPQSYKGVTVSVGGLGAAEEAFNDDQESPLSTYTPTFCTMHVIHTLTD